MPGAPVEGITLRAFLVHRVGVISTCPVPSDFPPRPPEGGEAGIEPPPPPLTDAPNGSHGVASRPSAHDPLAPLGRITHVEDLGPRPPHVVTDKR